MRNKYYTIRSTVWGKVIIIIKIPKVKGIIIIIKITIKIMRERNVTSGILLPPIDLKIDNLDRVSIPTKIVALLMSNTRFMGPLMASEQGVHSKLYGI